MLLMNTKSELVKTNVCSSTLALFSLVSCTSISMGEKSKRQRPNMEETEPRTSIRLAKKRVTMGLTGTVDDPEYLPYYMEAIKKGWAGPRQRRQRHGTMGPEVSDEVSGEVSGEVSKDQEETMVSSEVPG